MTKKQKIAHQEYQRKKHTSALFYLVFDKGWPIDKGMELIAEAHNWTVARWASLGRLSWRRGEQALLRWIDE